MTLPRWLRSPWAKAALAAGGWSALLLWLPRATAPAPAAPPAKASAKRIDASPIALVPGTQYAAAVVTHGAANFAGHSSVEGAASSRGFVDVTVSSRPISGWPWSVTDADWYIVGRYRGVARDQARHEGGVGGSGDVAEAFEAV